MLLHILEATPMRVWILLAALIALGISQSRQRIMSSGRAVALPVMMLVLSAAAVVTSFDVGLAAPLAWAAGIALALTTGSRLLPPVQARWSAATARLEVAGSWLPLALILSLFTLKYAAGVGLALHPELATQVGFAMPFSFAYGLFSGVFALRGLQLWRTRQGAAA